MTGQTQATTVGQLPTPDGEDSRVAATLTRLVWVLCVASIGVLALRLRGGGPWELDGLVAVDGLTAVMWVTVTFVSGIVHSYSRRYMAGNRTIDRFFGRVFAFTLIVMVLVAADALALFERADLSLVPFLDRPVLAANAPSKFFDSLAAGTPVVVTNPGWTRRFVERHGCGWFVPPEAPGALADRTRAVLAAPDARARAAQNAREAARRHFNRTRMLDRYTALLEGVAGVSPKRP